MSTWLSGEGILTSASALSHFGVTGLNVQNRQHLFVRLLHAVPSLKFATCLLVSTKEHQQSYLFNVFESSQPHRIISGIKNKLQFNNSNSKGNLSSRSNR